MIFVFLIDLGEVFFDLYPVLFFKNALVENVHTVLEHVVLLDCDLERSFADVNDYSVMELNYALIHMAFINCIVAEFINFEFNIIFLL